MEINQVDKEISDLVTRKSIYGIEVLINAIMREAINRPFIDRAYIHNMVDAAIDRAIKDNEEMYYG